jgi:hypothetical protein
VVSLYVLARILAHQLGACCRLVRCRDWLVDEQILGAVLRLCGFGGYGWIYDLGVHLRWVTWNLQQRTTSGNWFHSRNLHHSIWRFLELVCLSQIVAKELTIGSSERGSRLRRANEGVDD